MNKKCIWTVTIGTIEFLPMASTAMLKDRLFRMFCGYKNITYEAQQPCPLKILVLDQEVKILLIFTTKKHLPV